MIHPAFWFFFALAIIVIRLLNCGYEDLNKKQAYEAGQVEIIMSLPMQALSEIRVNKI